MGNPSIAFCLCQTEDETAFVILNSVRTREKPEANRLRQPPQATFVPVDTNPVWRASCGSLDRPWLTFIGYTLPTTLEPQTGYVFTRGLQNS